MSYDIRICAKVEGCGKFVPLQTDYKFNTSPSYNLREIFVSSMEWDYKQGEYYKCDFVLEKVKNGINNLTDFYAKKNKTITIKRTSEIEAISELYNIKYMIECTSEDYEVDPEYLYFRW